ncbi:hypothetical protein VCHENC02_4801A, partial [Vibrio harveyi]
MGLIETKRADHYGQ